MTAPATIVIGPVAALDLTSGGDHHPEVAVLAAAYSDTPTGRPSTIWSRYSDSP